MGVLKQPFFRGQSVHRLDDKGRLRIPAKFREVLQNNNFTDALIITISDDCLVAYPPERWEEIEEKAAKFSEVEPLQREFMRRTISSAQECEFDNQGRILIPPFLREVAGLEQDVLLAGMLKSFEIWNKDRFLRHTTWDRERHQEITAAVAGAGL